MKLSDVVSDVLLDRITQQIELGLVRPDNRAIGSYPVETLGRIFKTPFELVIDALGDDPVEVGAQLPGLALNLVRHEFGL